MSRRSRWLLVTVVVLLVGIAGAAYVVLGREFSARAEPSWIEAVIARRIRHLAVPRGARDRRNPVPRSAGAIQDGLEHFADHCAICHANDGSGKTEIGESVYPPAPEMRLDATQELSDGELFYIIENGVRLTGMPAWSTGTAEGDEASWNLVHFIRHLPKLTSEELERMEALNPRSVEELREEEEMRRFLEGEDTAPAEMKDKKSPKRRHGH